jgi:hypothetical protein
MKLLPFALAAVLFAGPAAAARFDACEFESDFDLRIAPDGLRFERDAGTPARVEMRAGVLRVDGREVVLSDADRRRVRDFERRIRALVPEVKAIAVDAVAIATDAVIQVAVSLAGRNDSATVARIERLGAELIAKIERADDTREWDEGEFERTIAALTAEVMPAVIGDVTAIAVQAALSGDERATQDLEARVQNLEKEIETRVEKRAKSLEARADALCPRLAELDALEAGLELRLAGDARLDLLQLER